MNKEYIAFPSQSLGRREKREIKNGKEKGSPGGLPLILKY
jgi:hypothetical protein